MPPEISTLFSILRRERKHYSSDIPRYGTRAILRSAAGLRIYARFRRTVAMQAVCDGLANPMRSPIAPLPGGRAAAALRRRGKSGLHETRVAGNARPVKGSRPKPRESATESIPPMAGFLPDQARVKGCGKSAPGSRQRGPHGKPHPEQGRIGAARRLDRQGCFAPSLRAATARVGCSSRGAIRGPDEWLPPQIRSANRIPSVDTEPGLQAPWHFYFWDRAGSYPKIATHCIPSITWRPSVFHRRRRSLE